MKVINVSSESQKGGVTAGEINSNFSLSNKRKWYRSKSFIWTVSAGVVAAVVAGIILRII